MVELFIIVVGAVVSLLFIGFVVGFETTRREKKNE